MKNIGILLSIICISFALEHANFINVTFIILSQNNDYNNRLASSLEQNIRNQYKHFNYLSSPKIYISHKQFDSETDWTITPLILPILELTDNSTQCVFFLEDRTNVFLDLLMHELKTYDFQKEIWIGHALHDSEASIIHHFAFYEDPTFFKYPFLGSGMGFSIPLLQRLKARIVKNFMRKMDFHIDPAHEFALFVYNNGEGPMIQHNSMFCCVEGPNCATYPNSLQFCGETDDSSIYFAVKTCHKYHKDRVEVVKKTWGKYSSKIIFFSDYEDSEVPTISLGIANTEQGHCKKTLAILSYAEQKFWDDSKFQWLALVDDDTILSVSRMASLTRCHNVSHPLILGERYRFGNEGFNYPTGGAGIILNRAALKLIVEKCSCPQADSPDDMVLGACAKQLGVVLTHVPQMHQARPCDYSPCRLANKDSISFHKHWMIDPIETYQRWFEQEDSAEKQIVKYEL